MDYKEKYNEWINSSYFDKETKEELISLKGQEEEIKDRFYKDLEFGTGGLRGIIGAGTNRINIYTIRKATQGLANYIIKQNGQKKGAAIAFDSRKMSDLFAKETALCLNANGIRTYIFDSLRPTPELSFAVRKLGCIAGIVITASHNPAEYNGYKVYWEDGAQITYPKDVEIIAQVKEISDYKDVKTMDKDTALAEGLYHIIGEEIDNAYIEELKKLVIHPISKVGKQLKIVYTPLHGTGNLLVRRILKEIGFEKVYIVKEQELPDSNFSTVEYPNPEEPKVFTLAEKLAKEVDADIILATDPDADRLGVKIKDKDGNYTLLTGNLSGAFLAEYEFSQRKECNQLPKYPVLIKTIVTGNMADEIAKNYQAELIEVLTGFKYIGEQIKFLEKEQTKEYVFGFEESYGCLVGTHARDKDAVAAVMAFCEAAAYYQSKEISLYEQVENLFQKYGYFKETLKSITLKGIEGMQKIQEIMQNYRNSIPKQIGGYQVEKFRDYKMDMITDLKTGSVTKTKLPKSDVLYFEIEGGSWCAVRPSGTEPKIKFYFGVKGNSALNAEKKLEQLINDKIFLID